MKKYLLLLVGFTLCFYQCSTEQESVYNTGSGELTPGADGSLENYYWLGDEKIPLQKMNNKFYVMYYSADEEKLKAECSKTGVMLDDMRELDYSQFDDIKNFDAQKFSDLKTATVEGDYEKLAPVLSLAFYAAPYYKTDIGEGRLTNRFSIELKNEVDVKLLAELADEHSVEILGVNELDGWYELACSNQSKGNALEMANMFYETGLFESVGYDLGARGGVGSIN
jgi:hypothetical protein